MRIETAHRAKELSRTIGRRGTTRTWALVFLTVVAFGLAVFIGIARFIDKPAPLTDIEGTDRKVVGQRIWEVVAQGYSARDRGQSVEAEALFRRAIEIAEGYDQKVYPKGIPWAGLAEVLLKQGRPKEALDSITIALNREPEHPEWWIQNADVILALGRQRDATDSLRRALELYRTGRARLGGSEPPRAYASLREQFIESRLTELERPSSRP